MRTIHLLRKYEPAQWGGTETAIQRLFDGLRHHGVQSVAYCPEVDHAIGNDPLSQSGHEVKRFHAFLPVLGISPQTRRQMISVGGNLMSFELVSSLWRERGASVIHTHALGRIGGIGRTIARQRKLPFVVTIHGGVLDVPADVKKSFESGTPGGFEWGRVFGAIFRSHRLFSDADAILTCNENEARLLREKYPDKRIVVQPHGVPLELFRQDFREQALAAFPQLRNRQVLLCLGRIDSVKNQGWLIEQAPRVFEEHPRAVMVLAGACTDEAYGAALNRRIGQVGLAGRVLLTGGLPPEDPRLIGLMQQAEVLVLPSRSETFGLVILEAWAAGTMVVSNRTSGASALVQHGQNGWLFDLDQPAAFHAALHQALANSDNARQVLRRSSDAVNREYNVVALAGRMKRLYEELIEEKNALRHHTRRRYQRAHAG